MTSWEPNKPTPPWHDALAEHFCRMVRTQQGYADNEENVVDQILSNRYGFTLHRGSFVLGKHLLLDTT